MQTGTGAILQLQGSVYGEAAEREYAVVIVTVVVLTMQLYSSSSISLTFRQ